MLFSSVACELSRAVEQIATPGITWLDRDSASMRCVPASESHVIPSLKLPSLILKFEYRNTYIFSEYFFPNGLNTKVYGHLLLSLC